MNLSVPIDLLPTDFGQYAMFFSCSGTPNAGFTLTENLCP